METIPVNIQSDHLFRYSSEIDPRKKLTKGGYLNGSIILPQDRGPLIVNFSTYPAFCYEEALLKDDPEIEKFQPCCLHLTRKKKNARQFDKEPVPFIQHHTQKFLVENEKVFVINQLSIFDEERSETKDQRPETDFLFNIKDGRLPCGKKETELNLTILKPKTDQRSAANFDITLKKMIAKRIEDETNRAKVLTYFERPKEQNKFQTKIVVEVFLKETYDKIAFGKSETIIDTASKDVGALDIHRVSPLKSCDTGGSLIIMVSEFKLAKDVDPVFQLYHSNDQRAIEEEQLLLQPTVVSQVTDSILFTAPPQPNLTQILERNLIIKLKAKRMSDKVESDKSFIFQYLRHNSFTYTRIDDIDTYSCIVCDLFSNDGIIQKEDIVRAKPGGKRRKVHCKGEENDKRIRSSMDDTSLLSPGYETVEDLTMFRQSSTTISFNASEDSDIMSPDSGVGRSPDARDDIDEYNGLENVIMGQNTPPSETMPFDFDLQLLPDHDLPQLSEDIIAKELRAALGDTSDDNNLMDYDKPGNAYPPDIKMDGSVDQITNVEKGLLEEDSDVAIKETTKTNANRFTKALSKYVFSGDKDVEAYVEKRPNSKTLLQIFKRHFWHFPVFFLLLMFFYFGMEAGLQEKIVSLIVAMIGSVVLNVLLSVMSVNHQ